MDSARSFMALVIYPTSADAQTRHADNLVRLVSDQIREFPGLQRARVFLSEDGDSLVTLTEWRDRESFQAFRGSEIGRSAMQVVAGLHPKAYWLHQHAEVEIPRSRSLDPG